MSNPTSQTVEQSAPNSLKLGDLLAIWRKRRWMILAIVVAVPLAAWSIVSKQPKVYEASCSIVIDTTVPQYLGSQFKDAVEIESSWWTAQETLQTELKVLKSYSQSVAVAKALCDKTLASRGNATVMSLFMPGIRCSEQKDMDLAARMVDASVSAVPLRDSRVVSVIVQHADPEVAAVVANIDAQVYAERNLERRIGQSEGAASWLGEEYGDITSQLNAAEHALIDFKKQNGVLAVSVEDQQNDLAARHKKLSEELNMVQVKLLALKAQRDQYAQYHAEDPMNDVAPGVTDSPVMQRLKELYVDQFAKLVELRGKYLDKHPTVVAQEARVQAIRQDMERESKLATKNVEAQYQTLVKQEKDLRGALEATTREALQLEQRAVEYSRLKRNYDRLAKLSEQVGGRERETSLAGHLRTNNVRVLDPALVPTAAISPNVRMTVAGAAAVGLVLALGLAFLLELLDSTVKSQDDIEKVAGTTFLGVIPTIGSEASNVKPSVVPPGLSDLITTGSKDLYVMSHPKSAVAECCRAIRTNLLFMTPDTPARSLVITSAGRGEGKTTTAVNLAITMAQSGMRVLLVDTDLRLPRLHKAFGIPASSDGVSRAILGEVDVHSVVRETGVPNLYLMPCGAIPPNPAELLHAERFKSIVAELTATYDRVIFDSPPVGMVTDAVILSRLTEGTVLVAKERQTSKDALQRARRLLSTAGVNLLGCILNDLDMSKPGGYGYYYYSRYGYYAGYGSDEGSKPASMNSSG